jgi:hypothetical protein
VVPISAGTPENPRKHALRYENDLKIKNKPDPEYLKLRIYATKQSAHSASLSNLVRLFLSGF